MNFCGNVFEIGYFSFSLLGSACYKMFRLVRDFLGFCGSEILRVLAYKQSGVRFG